MCADLSFRVVERIEDIDATAWDSCASDGNPFVRHAFLLALERSGSVGEKTGWLVNHLLLHDAAGKLVGAVPLYLKTHSQGEYVFDQGWAEAYIRAGGRYYPKIQVAIPFTPVPGPRLLVNAESAIDRALLRSTLARGIIDLAEAYGVSSAHVTFADSADCASLQEQGFMLRSGLQYHWHNQGYENFDDFLDRLNSRKRKSIRKERTAIEEAGLRIYRLHGEELTANHWDSFFSFYMDTGGRKWGRPYLTRSFFEIIGSAMAKDILLIVAEREGRLIAGALNFKGKEALFGRNWGCIEDHPFLHFELCYYQAIDYAIENRLARIEAGAQGEHKIARGYLPQETPSAHWVKDEGFREALRHFLERERQEIAEEKATLLTFSPYRQE